MKPDHGSSDPAHPTAAQVAAAISLLADDHAPVQAMARERLLRWGHAAIDQIRVGAESEPLRTRTRCRALLRAIEIGDSLQRFGRLRIGRTGRGSAAALLEGAVLLSNMVRTFVPAAAELSMPLRREAERLRGEFAGRSLPTRARLLTQGLSEIGLHGGEASVHDLDHVSIDRVLARGTGIPVTLSLIYLLVARQAGLSAAGVAMPDHFLVRLHGPRPVLVDPFHAGRTVTKADCARYMRANGFEQTSEHLRDLTDREVLIHYLRSLRHAAACRSLPDTGQPLGDALALLETS